MSFKEEWLIFYCLPAKIRALFSGSLQANFPAMLHFCLNCAEAQTLLILSWCFFLFSSLHFFPEFPIDILYRSSFLENLAFWDSDNFFLCSSLNFFPVCANRNFCFTSSVTFVPSPLLFPSIDADLRRRES